MIISTIAVLMVFIGTHQYFQQHQFKLYQRSKLASDKLIIDKVLEFKANSYLQATIDNSAWDELVDYMVTKDSVWVNENLGVTRITFDFTYLNVYDISGKLVYNSSLPGAPHFFLPDEQVKKYFIKQKTLHTFQFFNGQLLEIFGAAIVPSPDIYYQTKEKGYMITVKDWDLDYVNEIEKAIGFKLSILPQISDKDTTSPDDYSGTIFHPLKNNSGNEIAYLKFYNRDQLFLEFQSLKYTSIGAFGILLLFFIIFLYYINQWLTKPLQEITLSLKNSDPELVGHFLGEQNEFGEIAKLIKQYDDQKNELVAEVKTRTEATQRAEENSRLKSAFLSNMSHEIRTPMNAIMGFSALMAGAEGDEKTHYADIVQKSSKQLLSLIDDVILMSRLQSEKIPLNITEFFVAGLIREFDEMFGPGCLEKGLGFAVKIPEQYKDLTIRSDRDKIAHVLNNLISNALKYTAEGKIELGFDLKNGFAVFYINDTGIGISDQEQEKIFESFFRGDQVISSAIGGTGLGLKIAKEYVVLLGGEINVDSKIEMGTNFSFTVPIGDTDTLQDESAPGQVVNNTIGGSILLIAEDEAPNYLYLNILLKNKVQRIDHATNGAEAIEMASKNCYDLILMDLRMPVMSGIEATKMLKQQYPEIPIVVQTAYSMPEEREIAFQAGCDDFITKPINKDDLVKIIGKYVSLS